MLRVAEVTEYQERILPRSAALDAEKRDEEGTLLLVVTAVADDDDR